MAVKRPIYITEKGYTQEIDATIDTIEINKLQITADGYISIGAVDGYGNYPIMLADDGYASFANGAFYINPDGSTVSASGALQIGADGQLTVGTGAETASIDADGYMILSAIETTATDGYAILTEGAKFYVRASDGYVKIDGFASLEGGTALGSDVSVAGDMSVAGQSNFSGGVIANAMKIVGDLPTHLYIVGADGYMKDEEKLAFASDKLSVTGDGYFSGDLAVQGDVDVNGDLDVAGQVNLADAGAATNVRGTLSVAQDAVFSADLTADRIAIAGDLPTHLYIVGADGYMKDESNLVFDGSKLSVTGNVELSGDLKVAGNDIKSSTDAVALTLSGADVAVAGDLTVTGNDIKSSTATALSLSGADVAVAGDLKVAGNDIKSSSDAVALTLSGADVIVAGDLKVAGNDIKSSADSIAITLSGTDVAVAGDLTVTGNDIKSSTATALTLSGADVTVAGDLKVAGNDIKSSTDAIALTLSGADVAVAGDLTVTGNDIKSSSATALTLSGANVEVKGDLTVDGNIVADANENKSIFAAVASGSTVTIASTGAEVALPSAKVADLTSGRIVLAGTAGALEDSANLTFSSGALNVTGSANITGSLNVDGDTMALTGTAFSVNSTSSFAINCLADFNAGITTTGVKIDSDTPTYLYIVGADGSIQDESKLVFDGSKLSVTGDVELSGDLKVSGNDIKSSSGSIAITLSGTDVAVAGDLTVTGNDIKSSSATALSLSGADVAVAGDLKVAGNDIKSSTDAVALTLSGADVIVAGDLKVAGNDIKSGGDVVALTLSNADVNVKGNLTVDGNIVADANENKSIFAAVASGSTVTIASTGAEVVMPSAKVADLTSGSIVLAGTAGALEDSANLTFSAGILALVGNLSVDGDGYFSANKSISFASNSGAISGLANLDPSAGGHSAVNKNYVDAAIEAIGLDSSNTSSSSLVAAESISIGDPLFVDSNGKAARGDTTSTLNVKAWVFGVAAAAAAADASVEVVRDGIASGVLAGLGMSAGNQVWLAAGGGLTATKPSSGRLILMGFALSSSDLLVDVRDYGSVIA